MILHILVFIFVLAIVVLVHEWGHFFAARRFGMYVKEFGFGFPPRIWGKKKGETMWSINAIPLGGFVQIAGEDGEDAVPNSKEKAPFSEDATQADNTKTQEKSDREVIPQERYFSSRPAWQRTIVLAAGVCMNFLLGWLLFSIVFAVGASGSVVVTSVSPDSPAAIAGIKPNDVIYGFDSLDGFLSFVQDHQGEDVMFSVLHDGERQSIQMTPRSDVPEGQGPLGVGVVFGGFERVGIGQAIWEALVYSAHIFSIIFVLLFKLIASIFGGPSIVQNLSGPVGIYQATAQASGLGWVYLLNIIALISVNLAAINIFPFPALDGGRIVFLGLEKMKGGPVSVRVQQIVNASGFFIMIGLLIYVTLQDVWKLL